MRTVAETFRFLGRGEYVPDVFRGGKREYPKSDFKRIIPDGSNAPFLRSELAGVEAPKDSIWCISVWQTRIWNQISEISVTLPDIAGIKSNGFASGFSFPLAAETAVNGP
ncbi:hypothetical protein TNCV_4395671 [Trichonephila clavipes]|uniref:Uncharacterized protein n=1 Tax=Trichonephila clavipes TaxID=2585209 RepID=A0A8X7BEB9_TRICX|nr:hypothetical protein TNCV_4395671 [Trichonephila clavipes]